MHGGHVGKGDDVAVGFDNWRKTFAYAAEAGGLPLPVLIENTAGGDNACARRFDDLARLWDAVGEFGAGFCLDTCHAHAGGEDLLDVVDRVKAITGRIDLIHANDSKDAFDSGRDRHDNLGNGKIDPELVVAAIRAAGAPVIVETPGGVEGQAADIALLRERGPGADRDTDGGWMTTEQRAGRAARMTIARAGAARTRRPGSDGVRRLRPAPSSGSPSGSERESRLPAPTAGTGRRVEPAAFRARRPVTPS